MRDKVRFVGECSKYITGEGWVTLLPVSQLHDKGYYKGEETTWEERKDHNFKGVWKCLNCNRNYINVDKNFVMEMYKYCPNCGARIVDYLSLKDQREIKKAENEKKEK